MVYQVGNQAYVVAVVAATTVRLGGIVGGGPMKPDVAVARRAKARTLNADLM